MAETRTIFCCEGEPPRRHDRQYIALAIDLHGNGHNESGEFPRWCVVQWGNIGSGGRRPYWEWSVPERSTAVRIIKWAELPELDSFGEYHAQRAEKVQDAES